MSRQRTYNLTDATLILIALILIFGSGTLYIQKISLRQWILGWNDDVTLESVGTLKETSTGTLRQLGTETEFKTIQSRETLYNRDTIVTGDNGSATLSFEDGTEIALGPSTMVRLDFSSGLDLAGISRLSTLTVLTGRVAPVGNTTTPSKIQIQNREAPPRVKSAPAPTAPIKPSVVEPPPTLAETKPPAPIEPPPQPIQKVVPKPSVPFALRGPTAPLKVPNLSTSPRVTTQLSWKAPSDAALDGSLVVRSGSKEVQRFPLQGRASGSVNVTLDRPGVYSWSIDSSPETKPSTLTIERSFRGIQVLKPLIGGNVIKSSRLKSDVVTDDFDIQLRWKPYPGAKNYQVRFYKSSTGTEVVYEKSLSDTQYQLNKNKVFAGQIFYEVSTVTPNGFVAESGRIPFRFDYLPPVPVFPKQDVSISQAKLREEDNKVLFTWEKTNFTKNYEIQIARDEDFKDTVINKRTKENFYILDAPTPGIYYWRLVSIGTGVESEPSAPSRFKIDER